MNKFEEIRPVALGLVKRDNKLLVGEGTDKIKGETFYRCLGGGIEFLEKSKDALKREFHEEIGANITITDFLGISENIFEYKGKKAHELILFYSVQIDEKDYKPQYHIVDSEEHNAYWIDIDEFKSGNKILYPKEVFKYL